MYGNSAELKIRFNEFYSAAAFNSAIGKLNAKDGEARLDRAFQLAVQKVFTKDGGVRTEVPRSVCLMATCLFIRTLFMCKVKNGARTSTSAQVSNRSSEEAKQCFL